MPKATKRSSEPEPEAAESPEHRITIHLDEVLAARNLTLVELAARVGVTVANLSILKNGHARAVRFSTLTAICDALDCTPADLIRLDPVSS
jgi:putative transcriptional regulator